ncbi:hypothetical protein AURDEDRAFT_85720 [Auricularia subglabra TFB-10046 SS5]|nr:hypothetical protein AURDEDRAFT_85720 [Auricularia subglabra TFB-10046 SS5]
MRVADPNEDPGAFEEFERMELLILLKLIGVDGFNPQSAIGEEELKQKLRLALWDVQRLDYLFPGKTFGGKDKLAVDKLPAWPGWEEKHETNIAGTGGRFMMDAVKDEAKLESFVFRHFQQSAFTQMENMKGLHHNPQPDMTGAWYGVKNAMSSLAVEITSQGGDNVPFLVFYNRNGNMLVIEVLDVKQVSWPEPTQKDWKFLRSVQQTKFGWRSDGPIAPMIKTPKMPVMIIRYAYCEARPKDGLQYMLYLQSKIQKNFGLNERKAREKLTFHLQSGIEVPDDHLRTWARILDANAALIDREYVDEAQSHWSGLSQEAIKETRISFVTPCLRLRWRALEELETGVAPARWAKCRKCGKDGCKLSCAKCKSVMYCGAACNKADWDEHKETCKFSQRLLQPERDLPPNTFYVCTRGFHETILDNGFAVEQEAVKQSGCPKGGDCPPNEYAGARFVVRIQMPPDYVSGELEKLRGTTVFIVDRRRSLFVRTGPADVAYAKKQESAVLPFDTAGYEQFRRLVVQKGYRGQLIYLWAKRMGDCMELDLADIPDQRKQTWN